MLPLPMFWKPGPLKYTVALAALVLAVALFAAWGVKLSLTVGGHLRLQREGDTLALSLASLEAEAFNDFATSNRTIAAAYVAMNHAHLSRAGALLPGDAAQDTHFVPPLLVETLGQLMDTAHASQCARFAVTLGAVGAGATRGLHRTDVGTSREPTKFEQIIGMTNAAEFSRALEEVPCDEQAEVAEQGCVSRGSCFMRLRATPASEATSIQSRVYSYVASGQQASSNDEESALFTAHTNYHPRVPTRERPNLFAPFWRATLPQRSLQELRGLLSLEEGQ